MGVSLALHGGHVTTHGHRLLHLVQTLAAVLVTLLGAWVTQLTDLTGTFLLTAV